MSVPEHMENPVQPVLHVPLRFPVIAPGSDDSHENDWLNSPTFLPENLVPAHPVPMAFFVIASGSVDLREAAVNISVVYCIHGHADEFLMRETA